MTPKFRTATRLATTWRTPPPAVIPPRSDADLAWRRELLTMVEAGAYLKYDGESAAHSAYNFLHRHGVKLRKRGNYMLVRRGDIDDLLERGESDFVERARAPRTRP